MLTGTRGKKKKKKKKKTNTVGRCSQQEDLHSLLVFCCRAAAMAGSRDSEPLTFQIMTSFRAGKCSRHKCVPSPGVWICGGTSPAKARREVRRCLRTKTGHGADPALSQNWLHGLPSWNTASRQQQRNPLGHPPPYPSPTY